MTSVFWLSIRCSDADCTDKRIAAHLDYQDVPIKWSSCRNEKYLDAPLAGARPESLGISTLARQETATRCNPRATGSRSGDVTDAAFVVDLPPHHLDALLNLHPCYGDELEAQCPTDSGRYMTLFEAAQEISRWLLATFVRGNAGRRPVYGGLTRWQGDPHWRDLILFFEYFHCDNGAARGQPLTRAGPAWLPITSPVRSCL